MDISMLLTIANREVAKGLVENAAEDDERNTPHFPDPIRKRILNSTIKLNGASKSGTSAFNASGAIFTTLDGSVTILSAAHNLLIWGGVSEPPKNWSALEEGFAKKVKIKFGSGSSQESDMRFDVDPTGSSPIASVTVCRIDGLCRDADCMYDVVVIKSRHAGLLTFARNSVFGGLADDAIARKTKAEAPEIINRSSVLLDSRKHFHVQLGYGDIADTRYSDITDDLGKIVRTVIGPKSYQNTRGAAPWLHKHRLHYRIASPSYTDAQSYYNQTAETGEDPAYSETPNAISLVGRLSSTTAPGDSGGPLYAVDKKMENVYLLGVTTGADMFPAKKASKYVFRNVISTSIAPYLKTIYK
jgi:hypothetical protein